MRPGWTIASFNPGQTVPAYLLGVVSSQKSSPGWPASGRVVELGEPQAIAGQLVQVRSFDFATVATDVRETEVIGHDQDNIGSLSRRGRVQVVG